MHVPFYGNTKTKTVVPSLPKYHRRGSQILAVTLLVFIALLTAVVIVSGQLEEQALRAQVGPEVYNQCAGGATWQQAANCVALGGVCIDDILNLPEGCCCIGNQCGNGEIDIGETCLTCPQDVACSSSSTTPTLWCGNGIREYAEECDDGNTQSGDGCSASCIREFGCCANRSLCTGVQQCNAQSCACEAQSCTVSSNCQGQDTCCVAGQCVQAICGDGVVQCGEPCEPSNIEKLCVRGDDTVLMGCTDSSHEGDACGNGPCIDENGDGRRNCQGSGATSCRTNDDCIGSCRFRTSDLCCSADCKTTGGATCIATCGDGRINLGEQCEQNSDCLQGQTCSGCQCSGGGGNQCGNNRIDPGEECEKNTDCRSGEVCGNSCQCDPVPSFCGNFIIDAPNEQCDDGGVCSGGTANGSMVTSAQEVSECTQRGGSVRPQDADGCTANCILEHECGNGILEFTESCDDGGVCTAGNLGKSCTLPTAREDCGSIGICEPKARDGCDAACRIEECAILGNPGDVNAYTWSLYNLGFHQAGMYNAATYSPPADPRGHEWFSDTSKTFFGLYKAKGTGNDIREEPFIGPVDNLPLDPSYFAAKWEGVLHVPEQGNYTYHFGARDDIWVIIDGQVHGVDTGLKSTLTTKQKSIILQPGDHTIEIYYASRTSAQCRMLTELLCNDGRDDDRDAKTDCADPDCSLNIACGSTGLQSSLPSSIQYSKTPLSHLWSLLRENMFIGTAHAEETSGDAERSMVSRIGASIRSLFAGLQSLINTIFWNGSSLVGQVAGAPQCSDGLDNDGDTMIDFSRRLGVLEDAVAPFDWRNIVNLVVNSPMRRAYLLTYPSPTGVWEVNLDQFTMGRNVPLPYMGRWTGGAVIDQTRQKGYFAALGSDRTYVIRVDLAAMNYNPLTDILSFFNAPYEMPTAVIDAAGNFAYFASTGLNTSGTKIHKIDLQNFQPVNETDTRITQPVTSSAISTIRNEAYFLTSTSPVRFIRVPLQNFTSILPLGNTLTLPGDAGTAIVLNPDENIAYVTLTVNGGGQVVKVNLATLAQEGSPLILPTTDGTILSATRNLAGDTLFLGMKTGIAQQPGKIVKIDTASFQRTGEILMEQLGEDGIRPLFYEEANNVLFAGIDTDPDRFVKMRVQDPDTGCESESDPNERAQCSDSMDNADTEDTLADSQDPGCHANENFTDVYLPNDPDETHIPACGNGARDQASEQCDDGNTSNADACNGSCRPTTCGDGIRQSPNGQGVNETCDDGTLNGQPGKCNLTCTGTLPILQAQCGDGIDNEDPEDTLVDNADPGCHLNSNLSQAYDPNDINETNVPFCGNGARDQASEECDDGNTSNADACNGICQPTTCGDGVRQTPNGQEVNETCDDGTLNGQIGRCNSTCTGMVVSQAQCSDGIDNEDPEDTLVDNADPGCHLNSNLSQAYDPNDIDETNVPFCGNGARDQASEECDDGNTSNADACNWSCIRTICGDSIRQSPNGYGVNETCDDGTLNGQPGRCNLSCTGTAPQPQCGDGVDNADPEDTLIDNADPGCHLNSNLSQAYDPNDIDETHIPACGNGARDQTSEQCDDGNSVATDQCSNTCQPTTCGDGIRQSPNGQEVNETCDDGTLNGQPGRCNLSCTGTAPQPQCGDGVDNADPEDTLIDNADPGCHLNSNLSQAYDPNDIDETHIPACGNGARDQTSEQCDDGNTSNADACNGSCLGTTCGDGTVQAPNGQGMNETCEDGNRDNSDRCPDSVNGTCALARCGDRHIWNKDGGTETCDAGTLNGRPNQCNITCTGITPIACGNGVVETGENCDDGNKKNDDSCPDGTGGICQLARCGDAFLWNKDGGTETCDDGTLNGRPNQCNITCTGITPIACGNGVVETGENCDDGNRNNADSCPDGTGGICQLARCGDAFLWNTDGGTETCDAGTLNGRPNQCNITCTGITPIACGNGVVETGENCDDGNKKNDDSCPDGTGGLCQTAACGDGFIWNTNGGTEECDDANARNLDGCSASCRDEHICTLADIPSGIVFYFDPWPGLTITPREACTLSCGNGQVDSGETCLSCAADVACQSGTQCCSDGICKASCGGNQCGNGQINTGETCNSCPADVRCQSGTQCCSNGTCATSCGGGPCGNGQIEAGETCVSCPSDVSCQGGTQCCSDGTCKASCAVTTCNRNGICDANEDCSCDDCATTDQCTGNICGNDAIEPREHCDASVPPSDQGTTWLCDPLACVLVSTCGNGIEELGEQCERGEPSCRQNCTIDQCAVVRTSSGTGFMMRHFNLPSWRYGMDTRSIDGPPDPTFDPYLWWSDVYLKEIVKEGSFINHPSPFDGPHGSIDGDPSHHSAIWYGTVTVPQNGFYAYTYGTRDDAWILVDGVIVDAVRGIQNSVEVKQGNVFLPEGTHTVEIYYVSRQKTAGKEGVFFFSFDRTNLPLLPYLPGCSFCGNGLRESGEVCDSGFRNGQGVGLCNGSCTGFGAGVCGNGTKEAGEDCDDGNTTSGDGCSAICRKEAVCGDRVRDRGEECDDGNIVSNDGCSALCTLETICGDNKAEGAEQCDDGNSTSGDSCSSTCQLELVLCGNALIDDTEQCDFGGLCIGGSDTGKACQTALEALDCKLNGGDCIAQNNDRDGCDASCTIEVPVVCGNGVRQGTEECDYGTCANPPAGACNDNTRADMCRTACTLPRCGDTVVDSGEQCDTGDNRSDILPDQCRLSCELARCGDDTVDLGEQCDDGSLNHDLLPDRCRGTCRNPVCGDRVIDPLFNEQCDDGNLLNNDGCSALCHAEAAVCGNGRREPSEECDDGNTASNDGCSGTCRVEVSVSCGDGIVQTANGEKCDDGNQSNADVCDIRCQFTICGDGIQQTLNGQGTSEECDDANMTSTDACTNACKNAICGDQIIREGVEQCDDGNQSSTDLCTGTCTMTKCGDSIVHAPNSFGVTETCDDGNTAQTDSCTNLCKQASCGDGLVFTGVEQCDDGNRIDGDGCSALCVLDFIQPLCGNGRIDQNEQCDDGNTTSGDNCSALCQRETVVGPSVCGNSIKEGAEECDDGNVQSGDGCTPDCHLPSGGGGGGGPPRPARCGNRLIERGEQCDDGNLANGDGCNNHCQNETPLTCGNGSVELPEECDQGAFNSSVAADACRTSCKNPYCGDGIKDTRAGETCDDGNTIPGDSCSSICRSEVITVGCGNGSVDQGEECDTGSRNSDSRSDDCRTDCRFAVCGDSVVDRGRSEQCDDGNRVSSDGCSSSCQVELAGAHPVATEPLFSSREPEQVEKPSFTPNVIYDAPENPLNANITSTLGGTKTSAPGTTPSTGPETIIVITLGGAALAAWRRKRKQDLCRSWPESW